MYKKIIAFVTAVTAISLAYAANTIPSPYMGMPIPVVGTDPGPDWANNINASLSIVDQHDHSAGKGVQVTPAGLNISTDLPFLSNNATQLRSTRYTAQGSPLSGPSDLGVLYVSGVDLYYNDENGNQVRITQSGSVTGSSGTITGLPSGTASASFAASTFTFQSATNTPAIMAVGPLKVGTNTVSPKTVTIAPPGGLAANYNLTLPNGLPGSTSFLTLDTSGNMASVASTGSGNVVLSDNPTLSGTIAGNLTFSGSPTSFTNLVGIGSASPTAKLDVVSPVNLDVLHLQQADNSEVGFRLNNNTFGSGNGSSFTIGQSNTGAVSIGNNGTGVFTITSAQLVGVGTSSPASKLDVTAASGIEALHIGLADQTAIPLVINNLTFGSGDASGFNLSQSNAGVASINNNSNTVFSITSAGNVTNSHNLAVTGTTTTTGTATLNGAAVFNGTVTMNSTGGNAPHNCTAVSSSAGSTTSNTKNCAAGQIATGGGGTCTAGSIIFTGPPALGTPTGWRVDCSTSTTIGTYAICCDY